MTNNPESLTIAQALEWGIQACSVLQETHSGAETQYTEQDAKIDTRVLLCEVLDVTTAYLFTWSDKTLTVAQVQQFVAWIKLRQTGQPVAYIIGKQAFYDSDFLVAPCTLIPRPETEVLVDLALEKLSVSSGPCLDLGTGTGAIGLSIAKAESAIQVTAVDFVEAAVELAKSNASRLRVANFEVFQSDWFTTVTGKFAVIVSNPPYVEPDSPYLQIGDIMHEPMTALTAADDGLADIKTIIAGAPEYLLKDGWLLLEHGQYQGPAIKDIFAENNFSHITTICDYAQQPRITYAQYQSI
jgi:release factor glutamine methyltransferase